jgi:hypothetical protein
MAVLTDYKMLREPALTLGGETSRTQQKRPPSELRDLCSSLELSLLAGTNIAGPGPEFKWVPAREASRG